MAENGPVVAYELRFDENCLMFDTLVTGELVASGGSGPFNDTLYIKSPAGEAGYMLAGGVTSSRLSLSYPEGEVAVSEKLDTASSSLLRRQIVPLLLGGPGSGFAEWKLRTLDHFAVQQSIRDCEDTTLLRFSKAGAGTSIKLIIRDALCAEGDSVLLGEINSVGPARGIYFDGGLSLSGGAVGRVEIGNLTPDQFEISYDSIRAVYARN